jgi:hypothetical protein
LAGLGVKVVELYIVFENHIAKKEKGKFRENLNQTQPQSLENGDEKKRVGTFCDTVTWTHPLFHAESDDTLPQRRIHVPRRIQETLWTEIPRILLSPPNSSK